MVMCLLSHPSEKSLDVSIHRRVYMSTEDGIQNQQIPRIAVLHGDLDPQRCVIDTAFVCLHCSTGQLYWNTLCIPPIRI